MPYTYIEINHDSNMVQPIKHQPLQHIRSLSCYASFQRDQLSFPDLIKDAAKCFIVWGFKFQASDKQEQTKVWDFIVLTLMPSVWW